METPGNNENHCNKWPISITVIFPQDAWEKVVAGCHLFLANELSNSEVIPVYFHEFRKLTRVHCKTECCHDIHSDKDIAKGFCWGSFELTITEKSRLRLNNGIVDIFQKNKVSQLWQYPSYDFKGIILCPPENVCAYRLLIYNKLQKQKEMDYETSFYRYLSSTESVAIKNQGRYTLSDHCRLFASINLDDCLTIVGKGLWYELWHTEDFSKRMLC